MMTRTGQRALIRAARSCSLEAARADKLGQRHYAASLRASARRALREAGQDGDPLIRAIGCVKRASALAENLPGRDDDADGHDECVKTMHGEVQSGRTYLEQHLNPSGLPAKSRRRPYGESRTPASGTPASGTPASGTDNTVSGDSNLLRALDSLHKADVEADHLVDVLDDENERDRSASNLHFHVKSADESFQSYHDLIIANPEAEKRRHIARAYAKTIATALH